jgi:methionine-rich copper-binding protein CopC
VATSLPRRRGFRARAVRCNLNKVNRACWLIGTVSLLLAGSVWAHAHVQRVSPADGALLTTAPAELVLDFSEAARLTSVTLEKNGSAKQKVAPLPQQAQTHVVVALPALLPGRYLISWRSVAADGHIVPGQIHFIFKP